MLKASVIAADALAIQREGCGYIWGTSGEVWTQAEQWKLEDLYNSDPARYADRWGSATYGKKWIGKHVYDCSGLVMRILKDHGISVAHGSNSQYDKHCNAKGKLWKGARDDGRELLPGSLVFEYDAGKDSRHHVGIYVGGSKVVEAKGGYYGVVISSVTGWDEWGELKRVDYGKKSEEETGMETVRKGDKGAAVTALQESLVKLGYSIAVDGIFGAATQKAVKDFQKKKGLNADGVCGPLTWAALTAGGGIADGIIDAGRPGDGSGPAAPEAPKTGSVTICLDSETARQLALALKEAGVIV